MPRVPYVQPAGGESPVADKIRERRKNGELIPLDCVFLNAPNIAAGYDSLIGAIRNKNSLDGALRELLILRVAALNGAAYEWKAHEIVGIKEGLTTPELVEIRHVEGVGYGPNWAPLKQDFQERVSGSKLNAVQLAALDYTDASTRAIKVPKEVFERLRDALRKALESQESAKAMAKEELERKVNQQLVEVSATVGSYNLVSRFLLSMDVGDMAEEEVPQASAQ